MGVGSVSSTYCKHLWDPWPSASWWHFTVRDRPLTATKQQQAGKPPNSQMGKWCQDSTFRETFTEEETKWVSLRESAQVSCPSASPCNCCRHSTCWGLKLLTHYPMALIWQHPHWITQPAAGTWGRDCIHHLVSRHCRNTAALVYSVALALCKALQKSWESTVPSLHCAAKRGSLLSSRLPTAGTRPSCLHYELPTFCLHCQVAELKFNLNWGRLKNNPKLSQENSHTQKSHSRSERHVRHLINWICSKPALKHNFDIIKFDSPFVRNCCELRYFSGILKIFYLRRVFVFLNCKTAKKTLN